VCRCGDSGLLVLERNGGRSDAFDHLSDHLGLCGGSGLEVYIGVAVLFGSLERRRTALRNW